jgi:hypothetical protein
VVVSVMDRSQRDLVKRFNQIEVDWAIVEGNCVNGASTSRRARDSV